VQGQLFDTDSLVIRDSFAMAIFDSTQTVEADLAVELAVIIVAYELIGFSMFKAEIDGFVHN